MVMYNDIKEMKQDIKVLLAASVEDRVKIDYLEQEVNKLRDYQTSFIDYDNSNENNKKPPGKHYQMFAIIPNSKEKSIYDEPSDNPNKL